MTQILTIIQIIISLLLISLIFLQATGENESRANLLASASEKRGWDKILFNLTIFVLAIFILSSLILAFANK